MARAIQHNHFDSAVVLLHKAMSIAVRDFDTQGQERYPVITDTATTNPGLLFRLAMDKAEMFLKR